MARSGRAYPLHSRASRQTVWTSPTSVGASSALLQNISKDAPQNIVYATSISAHVTPYVKTKLDGLKPGIKINSEYSQAIAKIKTSFASIKEPTSFVSTNFILRDIARLPFNTELNGYVVRFRILSHDRNRTSAWSPFYVVKVPTDISILNSQNLAISAAQSIVDSFTYDIQNINNQPDNGVQLTITWKKLPGVEYVDVYEQFGNASTGPWKATPTSATNTWKYIGKFKSDQLTNTMSIYNAHPAGYNTAHYRYSFNRIQTNPYYSNTIPPTTYPIAESLIKNSRIFIATPYN